MLWMLMPFVWTKSLFMKLPVALESKSALTECTSLVSVVLISIGRTMDVSWVSRVLAESCLGSLFSHFGFWGRAFLSGVGASIGSLVSVLVSSMFNTVNLFTNSDRGALFAGCTKQNPLPERSKSPPPLLGYRSEEICAFSTVSFNKTSARPLHLIQVLALPPDDITRRLKKPEFYLSATITIRVEMTLITQESHSDYQHTSILTHSNSTTTTIRQQTPDFVLQQPRKKLLLSISQFSDTAMLVKIPSESQNISSIKWPCQSITKKSQHHVCIG